MHHLVPFRPCAYLNGALCFIRNDDQGQACCHSDMSALANICQAGLNP